MASSTGATPAATTSTESTSLEYVQLMIDISCSVIFRGLGEIPCASGTVVGDMHFITPLAPYWVKHFTVLQIPWFNMHFAKLWRRRTSTTYIEGISADS